MDNGGPVPLHMNGVVVKYARYRAIQTLWDRQRNQSTALRYLWQSHTI